MTDIRGDGLYFTPPHIVDFVLGSGAYLQRALSAVIGNPPFQVDFPVRLSDIEELADFVLPACTCPATCEYDGGDDCKGECGCEYHEWLWQEYLSSRQASV